MKKEVMDPNVSAQSNRLSFEVPTQFVPLPSNGKLYGPDSNLHDLEELEIRVMTAKEEDILTSQALIKKGVAIDRLLQSVVVDKSINIGTLIRGDRDALLVASRITGYGTGYEVKISCPTCDESSKYDFNLGNLPIRRLEIEPVNEFINAFSFELPLSKKQVIWKFLTGDEEQDITATQKKRKAVMKDSPDNLITLKLIHSIISIDGITDRAQIANFVRNMPARDSMEFRTYMDDNEPKILMEDSFECSECGEVSEVTVPMTVQFFWPNVRA